MRASARVACCITMALIVSSVRKTSQFLNLRRISYRLQPIRLKSSVELPVFASAFNPQHKSSIAFTDDEGRNFSYHELCTKSLHVARELQGVIKEPTQVSFLCPHCASFPITLWGAWLAGHTAVPLSEKHPDNLLAYFLKASKSQITVTVPAYAERLHRVAKEVGSQLVVIDIDRLDLDNDMEIEQQYIHLQNSNQFPHADALILFTSGTTGQPKGVLLSHGNIQDQVRNICNSFEINHSDTLLHVLPLHHTHGVIHALLSPLSIGARCHMLEKFSANQVWQQLLSSQPARPTILMGVPTVYAKLIEEFEQRIRLEYKPEVVKATCLQKMRLFLSGSASLPVPVLKKWESITGHRILERYGMTEVGVMLSNPLHGPRKPGFVGTPFPSVRIRLAEIKSTSSVKLFAEADNKNVRIFDREKDGTVIGDLLTTGPSVFKGYFNNPEATAKEFTEDGWFITGDTVEYTEGSFKVLGRKSVDIIKSGGYKLSSLQIESQLVALSEISEVAVMGIPDPVWGQRVAAVVVWSQGPLDVEELKQVAKSRMPSYMIPSVIKSMDHLPRNHVGKVNKKELAKVFDTEAV